MSLSIAQREVKKLVEQRHFVRVSLFLSFSVGIERSSGRRKEGRKKGEHVATPAFRGRCLPSAFFGGSRVPVRFLRPRGRIQQ